MRIDARDETSRPCHVANHLRCIYKQRIVARTGEDLHDFHVFADRIPASEARAGFSIAPLSASSASADRAHEQLDRMITGYWISQAIYAAAKFSIADHLSGGPKSVEELARLTSTNADALYRVLRALASVGIFAEGAPRQFALTPLAEPLRFQIFFKTQCSRRTLSIGKGRPAAANITIQQQ